MSCEHEMVEIQSRAWTNGPMSLALINKYCVKCGVTREQVLAWALRDVLKICSQMGKDSDDLAVINRAIRTLDEKR